MNRPDPGRKGIEMRLQYRTNNAYTYLLIIREGRCSLYTMDGSDDFPLIGWMYIEDHPEWEKYCDHTTGNQNAYFRPAVEAAALDYLNRIAPDIDDWSGGEETEDEEAENLVNWLESDDNTDDVCIAELLLEDGFLPNKTKTYYILRDLDGYGSESPICVDRTEADRLMREWYNPDDAPDFDDVWREADEDDIASCGRYDSDWN